jgi:uncharacterized protein (TIGR03437 family)
VFMNWASATSQQMKVPRSPSPASTKSASGMGPVGMWVNGVAIFNVLDGASYSNARSDDAGGGGVSPRATHLSAASLERGPLALGSIVTAFPEFNATLATSTEGASSAVWPTTLGGATVTVTDSAGVTLPAGILYASPTQINYQLPSTSATGLGRVTITAGGTAVTGTVNIVAVYPGLFNATQTLTVDGNSYLILYGTGIGASPVTATIGGINATVLYSGPQGIYPGLDQVNLLMPSSLAGKGRVDVLLTAAGKPSSPISVVLP